MQGETASGKKLVLNIVVVVVVVAKRNPINPNTEHC